MLKRFAFAFFAFVGLIVPGTFTLALLAAPPARPAAAPGCDRDLTEAEDNVAVMRARVKNLDSAAGPEMCRATQRYFFELVNARAVTALCKNGAERDRDLGRLDADVAHINEAIAARCP